MSNEENKLGISCLKSLVFDLTTSGNQILNEKQLKSIKQICKKSDFYILELFQILLKEMKKKHAQIRLSSFQICDEIFQRSHCFRELILKNFDEITELIIGTNPDNPLPKPLASAKILCEVAITAIQKWYDKFEKHYINLRLGYKFLKECKNIDFEARAILTEQDRRDRIEQQRKQDEIQNKKIGKILQEMEDKKEDIENTVVQFQNAFKLLIPDLYNFFIPLESEEIQSSSDSEMKCTSNNTIEYGSDWMREHGINKETVIKINLSEIHKVQETKDNLDIIKTIQEHVNNIKKNLLPRVQNWERTVLPYSSSVVNIIKEIIELKNNLESALKKYSSIEITKHTISMKFESCKLTEIKSKSLLGCDSDSDDDDFIDVPFENPDVLQEESDFLLKLEEQNANKTNFNHSKIDDIDISEAGPSGISHSISPIKKRKFIDIDEETSFYEAKMEANLLSKTGMNDLNRVWGANASLHEYEDGVVKRSELMGIATRAVHYEREWEPISWNCRHLLPSGRLCPRKDRKNCPLHGLIVPRDEFGKPMKAEDLIRDQERKDKHEREHPAWQDPSLLADIKASTGIDLDMKNVKKRKKKYPNLTDLKAAENTPRNRLSKKIFGKKSISPNKQNKKNV